MVYLPEVRGYPVGITTFITPVTNPRFVGSIWHRNPSASNNESDGKLEPALFLEEVAFTAYYPAGNTGTCAKGVNWLLRPLENTLRGFAAFSGISTWILWPIVYLFGALIKIPGYANAPLLHPGVENTSNPSSPAQKTSLARWPLVIFSHGLGGSRTAYSQFCSNLAASGKVVLAVEHRDGTGTLCMPRTWSTNAKSEPRTVYYLKDKDVIWPEDNIGSKSSNPLPLRVEQLNFRRQEIYTMYSAFCRFLQGDRDVPLETIDGSNIDKNSWTAVNNHGRGVVGYDEDIAVTGHSFGGCTAISILSNKPAEEYQPIPISRALLLDPWLEPLPSPGPVLYLPPDTKVQSHVKATNSMNEMAVTKDSDQAFQHHPHLLIINSETFTLWKDHFSRLQDVVAGWASKSKSILTIGSQHSSFSDFLVLLFISNAHARTIMDHTCRLSVAFLDGHLEETFRSDKVPTTSMDISIVGVKKDGKPKRKLLGRVGDVIIHEPISEPVR